MLPLASHMEFSVVADLAIAVLLGFGFGFCLERAGFGSARKLTAVFYFFDMSVVKVMFTAIVTAMVGLFALSAAGALSLSELYIEPTSYAAQILGNRLWGRLHHRRLLPRNVGGGDCDRQEGRHGLRARHAGGRDGVRRVHAWHRSVDQGH